MKWRESEGIEGTEFIITETRYSHYEMSERNTSSGGGSTKMEEERRQERNNSYAGVWWVGNWASKEEAQKIKRWREATLTWNGVDDNIFYLGIVRRFFIWDEEAQAWRLVKTITDETYNAGTSSNLEGMTTKMRSFVYEGKQRSNNKLEKRHVFSLLNTLTRLTSPRHVGYLREMNLIFGMTTQNERETRRTEWEEGGTTDNEWTNQENEAEGYWTITERRKHETIQRTRLRMTNLDLLRGLQNWEIYRSYEPIETTETTTWQWQTTKRRKRLEVNIFYGEREAKFRKKLTIRETKTRSVMAQTERRCKRLKKKKETESEEKVKLEGEFFFEEVKLRTQERARNQGNEHSEDGDRTMIAWGGRASRTKGELRTGLIQITDEAISLIFCDIEVEQTEERQTKYLYVNDEGETKREITQNLEYKGTVWILRLRHNENADKIFLVDELSDGEDTRPRTRRRKLVCT